MPMIITGVSLDADLHLLLRSAARGVQRTKGGKASASALISSILRRHAGELQALASGDPESQEASACQRAEGQ